ncbi:MAG: regulatory protein RecX [Deltaproteobacteria bacterium]|nr:regulatory protein RecX [Deltaproteobacteria bacterium]
MPPDSHDPSYRKALSSALRLLGRRDYSVAELRQKLIRRDVAEDVIQTVLAECLRLNYLDDTRTAHALIERFKRRGCGLYRIRHELAQRGLSGETFRDLLEQSLAPSEERELARRTLQKKLKTLGHAPEPRKQMLRLQRFLRGRGFSDAVIADVFEDLEG